MDQAVGLLNDEHRLKQWQDDFVSLQCLTGKFNQTGAMYIFNYQFYGRNMEVRSTVIENNLPTDYSAKLILQGMEMESVMAICELPNNKIKWTVQIKFIPKSFIFKILSVIKPSTFMTITNNSLESFKSLLEDN